MPTRRSRRSTVSSKSTIEELYKVYSERYDRIEALIGKKYGAEMLSDKLSKSSFAMQFKSWTSPTDPREREKQPGARKATQREIEDYLAIKKKRLSAQRAIETIVTRQSTDVGAGTARGIVKRLRAKRKEKAFEILKGDDEDLIIENLSEEQKKELKKIESQIEEVEGIQVPKSAEQLRYMRTDEFWDYIRNWYDEEGRDLYREARKAGKSGKEAVREIYDMFFYNGS